MAEENKHDNPFNLPDISFEEYRNQEVVETNDGAFFDGLDKMFGIKPRTDELLDEIETGDKE